jgi:hypothetical protein
MKSLKAFALTLCVALALAASRASAQNLLANPGFEDPITMDGPPFVGSWEGFQGGDAPVTAAASNSTDSPRTGAQSLKLLIGGSINNFAGAFQDVPGLIPGQPLTFSGFQRTPSSPLNVVNEIRIEWRNSVSNTEISRTANFSPIPGSVYAPFSINGVVPAGADIGRVVYAIQTFSDGATHTGTVYIDDVSAVVPEPTAMAFVAVGGLTVLRRRRAR